MGRLVFVFLFAVFRPLAAQAQADAPIIETEARQAVIMDFETGAILFSKNGDAPMVPASMTKMMTAQVVFDRILRGEIALTDTLTTSERAWREGGWASGGSTMGLAIGDEPTVAELLRGVIVLSGNDACIVLAEGLAGSEEAFARDMNALAADLNLTSARFDNATGLYTETQRVSAVDLARLAAYQIADFPDLYELYAIPSYEWRGISQPNRNPLLTRFEGADGLKTGHLEQSGYGLTASAERDGVRRILVVNGLESEEARARESERLMRLAFSSFETRRKSADGAVLAELDVALGARSRVGAALKSDLQLSGHLRAFDGMTTEVVYDGPIPAPVKAGDAVGVLIVTIPGQDPVRAELVAVEDVPRLGLFGRAVSGVAALLSGGDEQS